MIVRKSWCKKNYSHLQIQSCSMVILTNCNVGQQRTRIGNKLAHEASIQWHCKSGMWKILLWRGSGFWWEAYRNYRSFYHRRMYMYCTPESSATIRRLQYTVCTHTVFRGLSSVAVRRLQWASTSTGLLSTLLHMADTRLQRVVPYCVLDCTINQFYWCSSPFHQGTCIHRAAVIPMYNSTLSTVRQCTVKWSA